RQRTHLLGTGREWKKYQEEFGSIVAEETYQDGKTDRNLLSRFFRKIEESGTPVVDRNGALYLQMADGAESSSLGLSASNIFSPNSDRDLAHELMPARVGKVLKSPKHSRENMVEFKGDWDLL